MQWTEKEALMFLWMMYSTLLTIKSVLYVLMQHAKNAIEWFTINVIHFQFMVLKAFACKEEISACIDKKK